MTMNRVRTVICDEAACRELHAATLRVLGETGVEVQHEEALDLLRKAGAQVDGARVRLPAGLVDDALAAAPRTVQMAARPRQGEAAGPAAQARAGSLELRSGITYFGSGSDCLYLLGPGSRDRRPVRLADVEELAALQDKLANFDFVMSMAHPSEVPPAYADAAQFAAMLRATAKPILMVTARSAALPVMKEMAAVCGAADSWGIYAMPTPPLVHGRESAETLIACARLDVPMAYATALLQGATAPASRAGMVVIGNAEALSGLVITQLAKPGAPYVYGVAQGALNLRTSHVLYNAPESYAIQQACVDLADFYGLPSFGYGGVTDSPLLDEQWALEAGSSLVANAISGVTLLHDIGYAASGTASSFESMVAMDEMVAWVRAYLEGVTIDAQALAVDEIAAVAPGGTHLGRQYTRRHYRDWFMSDLFSQQSHEAWESAGATSFLQRVAERTTQLRAERSYHLAEDSVAELERLVKKVEGLSASAGQGA